MTLACKADALPAELPPARRERFLSYHRPHVKTFCATGNFFDLKEFQYDRMVDKRPCERSHVMLELLCGSWPAALCVFSLINYVFYIIFRLRRPRRRCWRRPARP